MVRSRILPVSMDGSHDILTEAPVVVVMVPLPAQGHLNQLLNLSRLLSARGIPTYYVGSATHNRQAKLRVHGWEPSTLINIRFHENLREPLAALLKSLSTTSRRVVVVHDSVMSFAAKEACSIPNGEAYIFHTVSALALFFYKWEALGSPTDGGIMVPSDLPHVSSEDCFTESFRKFIAEQYKYLKFASGYLYNTCRATEDIFIDLLAQEKILGKKKQWPIGPLNPVLVPPNGKSRHYCLDWLDKQLKNSVLYVSFGTMTSLSDEQITELAIGLEYSKQRFIWVLREADRGDIFAEDKETRKIELSDGYEERVKGVGMIVRDWAPQLEILAHTSTGGFLSHCGWNSCMESFSMGVPIAAWPMHSDQPRNTILVTHILKVGLVVRDWSQRKEVLSSSAIQGAVKKLMVSAEGEEMRERARELSVAVRNSVSTGGTSTIELESFIAHISR